MRTTITRRVAVLGAVTALSTLGLQHAAMAADPQYLCSDNTQPIATESMLTPNEAVTAKTVVSGNTPTTLSGTYIGAITDGIATGKDMLLIRITDDPVVGSGSGDIRAGIWAGMSGSPVYDASGNLIGAISYSLNSSSSNIAGVTPIADMKAIGSTSTATPARKAVRVTKANGTTAAVDALSGKALTQVKAVPVASGRVSSTLQSTLAALVAKKKVAPTVFSSSVATTAAASEAATPLVAGGNLFVGYSSGSQTLGGLGTVTAICGTKIWGFGHPMDQSGATQLSIANASAASVVPDDTGTSGSYKQVATVGAPQGTITQDRLSGVTGVLGTLPTNGVPMTSTFTGPLGTMKQTSTVYGQDNLALIALYQSYTNGLQASDAAKGSGTIGVAVVAKNALGTTSTVRTKQFFSDSGGVQVDFAYQALGTVAAFASAPVDNTISEVRMQGTLSEKLMARNIAGVQVKSSAGKWKTVTKLTAKRGQKVTFRTLLYPAPGTGLAVTYTPATVVTIPSTFIGRGTYAVIGGAALSDLDGTSSDNNSDDDDDDDIDDILAMLTGPTTWSQFVQSLQSADQNNGLYTGLNYTSMRGYDVSKSLTTFTTDAQLSGIASVTITAK